MGVARDRALTQGYYGITGFMRNQVEMGVARDRALTHISPAAEMMYLRVEMGVARDRALTQNIH